METILMSFEPLRRLSFVRTVSFGFVSVPDHPLPLTASQGLEKASDRTAADGLLLHLLRPALLLLLRLRRGTVALRRALLPALSLVLLEVVIFTAVRRTVVVLVVILPGELPAVGVAATLAVAVVVRVRVRVRVVVVLSLVVQARVVCVCAVQRVPLAVSLGTMVTRHHVHATLVSREAVSYTHLTLPTILLV